LKAWHVQDKDGEFQQIVFANKRHEAIDKSEARGWADYIDVRAKRAKYADGLESEPDKLIKSQLNNSWWLECHGNCRSHVTQDDQYTIKGGHIYCEVCSKKA
jgi:hypothetical protein